MPYVIWTCGRKMWRVWPNAWIKRMKFFFWQLPYSKAKRREIVIRKRKPRNYYHGIGCRVCEGYNHKIHDFRTHTHTQTFKIVGQYSMRFIHVYTIREFMYYEPCPVCALCVQTSTSFTSQFISKIEEHGWKNVWKENLFMLNL